MDQGEFTPRERRLKEIVHVGWLVIALLGGLALFLFMVVLDEVQTGLERSQSFRRMSAP